MCIQSVLVHSVEFITLAHRLSMHGQAYSYKSLVNLHELSSNPIDILLLLWTSLSYIIVLAEVVAYTLKLIHGNNITLYLDCILFL